MNSIDLEIREKLTSYLAMQISLVEFEDWFVTATWEIEKIGNPLALGLANEIDHRLAEFTSGHLREEGLRDLLKPLTQRYSVKISLGSSSDTLSIVTGS